MRITERQLRAIIKEQYREIISEMTREDHYNSLVAKKERVQDEIDRIEDETDVPPPSGYDSSPHTEYLPAAMQSHRFSATRTGDTI